MAEAAFVQAANGHGERTGGTLSNDQWSESRPASFMTDTKLCKAAMHTHNPVERAFQLTATASSIDEIRAILRREGYANVDAHLAGASIKADLKRKMAAREA